MIAYIFHYFFGPEWQLTGQSHLGGLRIIGSPPWYGHPAPRARCNYHFHTTNMICQSAQEWHWYCQHSSTPSFSCKRLGNPYSYTKHPGCWCISNILVSYQIPNALDCRYPWYLWHFVYSSEWVLAAPRCLLFACGTILPSLVGNYLLHMVLSNKHLISKDW